MDRYVEFAKTLIQPSVSGFSYAVMQHQKTVCKGAFGRNYAKTEDLYGVGSVSKVYVTAAVMMLAQQGKLSLQETVCSYLPRFRMADPRYRRIKVIDLLCHTSGLPGTAMKKSFNNRKISDYYEEQYRYFEKAKLKAEPGEFAVYCNDGFTLAEMIVAEVAGMPYAEFLKQNITGPIGAHSTVCANEDQSTSRVMTLQNRSREILALSGAGGIQSNMEDVCKFGGVFLGWYPDVLSKESIAIMQASHGPTFLTEDTHTPQYGLGWDYIDLKMRHFDLNGVWEKGGTTLQFNTAFVVMPQYDLAAAASATMDHGANVLEALMRIVSEFLFDQNGINLASDREEVPPSLRAASGIYHGGSQVIEVEMGKREMKLSTWEGSEKRLMQGDIAYQNGIFYGKQEERFSFQACGEEVYLLRNKAPTDFQSPMAQKFGSLPQIPEGWKSRIGKRYLVANADACDLFIGNIINGAEITLTPDHMLSVLILGTGEGGVRQNITFMPDGDEESRDILKIPAHGGRDLATPFARRKDGIDYLFVNTYWMREVSSLPLYQGELCPNSGSNALYYAENLETLPDRYGYERLIVTDEELHCVYDSETAGEFCGVKKGYIMAIDKENCFSTLE